MFLLEDIDASVASLSRHTYLLFGFRSLCASCSFQHSFLPSRWVKILIRSRATELSCVFQNMQPQMARVISFTAGSDVVSICVDVGVAFDMEVI